MVTMLDMALSGVVDTVGRPYTLVKQHRDGCMEVN
ncbi:YceK/YidQ family lipoprotein [Pseudomonas sp. TE3610]